MEDECDLRGICMKVLVTGATGAVGPVLVDALLAAGAKVRILSRKAPRPGLFQGPVTVCLGDVRDASAVAAAASGVSVVYHLAGMLHVNSPKKSLDKRYRQINVTGTANVMDAAAAAGACRVIFFSTISVYGPGGPGRVFDEDAPLNPTGPYAETKCEAERIVLGRLDAATGRPLGVVLRLAAVYGPRVRGNYDRMIRALFRGVFLPVGEGENRRTLVFDRDVAAAALLAAKHPNAAGQVFNVTDGTFYSFGRIVSVLCRALDRPAPKLRIPAGITAKLSSVRKIAGLPGAGLLLRGLALLEKMQEDVAVSGDRIRILIGFTPRYSLAEGMRRTVMARLNESNER